MSRFINIIGLILLILVSVAPVTQMFLIRYCNNLIQNRQNLLDTKWIMEELDNNKKTILSIFHMKDENNKFEQNEKKIDSKDERDNWIVSENSLLMEQEIKEKLDNAKLYRDRCDELGVAYGRSHPMISNEKIGANIVIDGIADWRQDLNFSSFWSFYKDFLPAELTIQKTQETNINWVFVIPRWEWQVAFEIYITRDDGMTQRLVPLHYHDYTPVRYHFFQQQQGNGIRLIISDAKVASNNAWATPIYEVGAGYSDDKSNKTENPDS